MGRGRNLAGKAATTTAATGTTKTRSRERCVLRVSQIPASLFYQVKTDTLFYSSEVKREDSRDIHLGQQ